MTNIQKTSAEVKRSSHRTSLAGSLTRTLMIFTFVPLMLMAGAAYLHSRTLFADQVSAQMRNQLAAELNQLDLAIKAKQIGLDNLMRQPNFDSELDSAISADPHSNNFSTIRNNLSQQMRSPTPQAGNVTFNQFFLMLPNGIILMDSQQQSEGSSLANSQYYQLIANSNDQTFAVYNFPPLYKNQFVLITVTQYQKAGGSRQGTLVGVTEQQSLQDVLHGLASLTPSSNAYFVTHEGKLIEIDPHTTGMAILNPSPSQNTQLTTVFNALMISAKSAPQSIQFSNSINLPVLAQAEWLPSINAGLVWEIPQDVVFGQLNSLAPLTLIIIALALLAIALVIRTGNQRIFRPLQSLITITSKFASGDFSVRAEVRGQDEIAVLADSFNHMAEELTGLYRSLEQKVEERTRQIRIAAEIVQRTTSSTNLDELLNRTTELIVQQFGFYHAAIYLVDHAGKHAILRSACSPAAHALLESGHQLEVGSTSIVGWVTANNQPHIASDVTEDSIHMGNKLLPETHSEAGVPISIGGDVFGALDVQSTQSGAFGPDAIVTLQTLASQIAVAIHNINLSESTQGNTHELERLYHSNLRIAAAQSKDDLIQIINRVLQDSPFASGILMVRGSQLEVVAMNDSRGKGLSKQAVENLSLDFSEIQKFLSGNPIIVEEGSIPWPVPLRQFRKGFEYPSVAFLPIKQASQTRGLIVLGGQKESLTSALVQPYIGMTELVGIMLGKIEDAAEQQSRLREFESITSISQAVSTPNDLDSFYSTLHTEVRRVIGDYPFVVAVYEKENDSITIPYMYEDGKVEAVEAFPLGEGLTSILIRSLQPLLLVEDTEKQAEKLGAKIHGKPAKSWMGAPMIVQGEPIGALIVQDVNQERSFNSENLRFLTSLANQVAGVLYNARLLEGSRLQTIQLETAAQIARDISGSLNLDELLKKAVNFIHERFNLYHASIFLIDLPGEFAVIRESTGEAGSQMKRAGHKLGVGSKSVVGYVAGRGEALVVNDTAKDATYYANPLLPETRAEAAIPFKVGDRIVGVLDVQSIHAYAFTEDNLRTLQILADQLAIAVVNSELFAETQEHLSQHRLLHHITSTAASGTTLEEALDSAVSGLQVTLGGDRVSILMPDSELKFLEVKASVGYSQEVDKIRVPIGSGITGWVAEHRRLLRVDNVADDTRYIQASPNTHSELAIPLLYRNEILGVLNVESEQIAAYNEDDEEMLGTLGGSLAAIIANARLVEQVRNQSEYNRMIYEITSKIRRSTDMQTILTTTASELTKAVGARYTKIAIAPENENNGNDSLEKGN